MSSEPQSKVTHHFGRGGAGNVTAKDPKSPALPPSATPTLKGDHYTTGRGGSGNMAKNDPANPEEARAAQDVDVPGIMLGETARSTGRGGAANYHQPTEEEKKAAQAHNQKIRTDSASRGQGGLKDIVQKGKDLLKGKKNDQANESAVTE